MLAIVRNGLGLLAAVAGFAPIASVSAQSEVLPAVEAVASTPGGSEVEQDALPYATSIVRPAQGALLPGMEGDVGGVSLSHAQNNPFQPSLVYRGFEASPLGGNPQGLAVYLDGIRFNPAFGDTVNWDLIPDVAIDRITVAGADPAFGLNALGGSIAADLKTGFSFRGTELTTTAGAFGRLEQSLQHGRRIGDTALYVAARGLHDDGYRPHSPSRLRQLYADLGRRRADTEVHLNLIGASNDLIGNGSTPVELIAADRNAVFTYPDRTRNEFMRLSLSGRTRLDDGATLRGNLHYGRFRQQSWNGDAAEVEPCEADAAILCAEDGAPLRTPSGAPVPNMVRHSPYADLPGFTGRFAEGGPYALLNETRTRTHAYGGTMQVEKLGTAIGRSYRLVAGASFDGGDTAFAASSAVGALTLDRGFGGQGITFSTDDGAITPVDVRIRTRQYGLFLQNMFALSDRVMLTAGGRFNGASIALDDRLGTALNGDHAYRRFNPQLGATYAVTAGLSLYAGYAEANRTPTPAELACADPAAPCSLTNFFVGDPPLKQVVSHTIEAGLRGGRPLSDGGAFRWHAGYFRIAAQDDIRMVASETVGRAYFRNVGDTLRQGLEVGARVSHGRWSVSLEYALTAAEFRSGFVTDSPLNPVVGGGAVAVRAGDRIPNVPLHALKLGADVRLLPGWSAGMRLRAFSGRYLVGDEANLTQKTTPYAVVDLTTSYRVNDRIELFGRVENVFDRRYASFGTFSPTEDVPIVAFPAARNPRSLSIGMPRAAYAGLRISF